MTVFDEIILRVFLDNNAYSFLKSTSEPMLAIVDAGLDTRLAIVVFFITAATRLTTLRFANTHRDIWGATKDIIWTGAVLHAGVMLLRMIAEILQLPLWPAEMRVNLHAVAWVILLAIFPIWILTMREWLIGNQPGQPETTNEGTAP